MVAIANAGWPHNDNPFPGFAGPMMPSLRFGPLASQSSLPGMPNFGQNFPFFQLPAFPTMPAMTFPSLPSASDIANAKPGKGGTFTGVVITSKTEAKRKDDGTIVKESGSTILMNNDGVVTVKKCMYLLAMFFWLTNSF
uniref:Seroin transcript 1B n=1 Tax=Mamestra brassicae TaxID=55057 RepID=A0A455LAN2_MAMBR|nr:seroin transcript 1B [Mamestra brassicae]